MTEWRSLPWLDGFEISENGDARHTGPVRPGQRKDQRLTGGWKASGALSWYRVYRFNGLYFYAHRLVCEAFHGPAPDGKPNALHNDGDSRNNHFTNLRWGSQKDNIADSMAHGVTPRGSRNGAAKLCEADVVEIRARLAAGARQYQLAHEFGCSKQNISKIACMKVWGHIGCAPTELHLGEHPGLRAG